MASVSNRARGGECVDPEDVLDMVLDDDEDLGGMSSSAESDLDRQLENQSEESREAIKKTFEHEASPK